MRWPEVAVPRVSTWLPPKQAERPTALPPSPPPEPARWPAAANSPATAHSWPAPQQDRPASWMPGKAEGPSARPEAARHASALPAWPGGPTPWQASGWHQLMEAMGHAAERQPQPKPLPPLPPRPLTYNPFPEG